MTNENIVHKSLEIAAPTTAVWAALTDARLLSRWMLDSEINVKTTWEIGCPILFWGDLHDLAFVNKGTILKVEPARLLEYSFWSSLTEVPDEPEYYSLVTYRLSEAGSTTQLDFTQSNFPQEAAFKHANFYWSMALYQLKRLTENRSQTTS